jgi:hypothetical protein
MKIKLSPANQGAALVVSLLIAVVLLICLTSYLALVSDENQAVGRAQAWNAAMPMAEAGVEEALTQLQYAGNGTNLATNGWTLESDGLYHKSRTMNSASYYAVAIQPATDPTIWSTGYVSAPIKGGYIGRLVKVQAIPGPSFGQGITSKGDISLSGGAYMDSYAVTNGVYDMVATGEAVALTDTNVAGAISLNGSPYIEGYVETGAGPMTGSGATLTTIGGGIVGDTNYIASGGGSGSPNVEAGHYSNNANFQFTDISAPSFTSYYTSFMTLGSSNIAGVSGQTSYYQVSSLSTPLYIYGNVTMYLTAASTKITGSSGYIDITTNSTLTLYLAGAIDIEGGGVINGNGRANALTIYGLPTCTSITYGGGANFIGVVDAPEANFAFNGNESAIGAFVVNSCSVKGTGGVHWDSSLSSNGGFLINNWNEMSLNY